MRKESERIYEHLSSHLAFSGVHGTRSLVLYVCFVDCCFSFCTFSFGHCVVCSSWILIIPLISSNSSYHVELYHGKVQGE
jgi:hypothetical protein